MKKLLLFCFLIFLSNSLAAQSDEIKAAWTKAKALCNDNQYVKAMPYLQLVYTEMPRPLCCYWLGFAYDIKDQRDSAIFYYNKSIKNSQKPQLAAWDQMIRCHLRDLDFETAYAVAWDAMQKYPGNQTFLEEFKDVCLWAYFIKHLGFHKQYLSSKKLNKEYQIKTVTEQYLIIRNIRNENGQPLHVGNRQYKGQHEIWKCRFNNSKEELEIKFHLHDHNLDRELEKQHKKAKEIYNNKENPIHIRIGALMSLTPFEDKVLLDLLASEDEAVRFCACSEVKAKTSKKVKKACQNDKSEMIKAMCEQLEAFE